MKKIILPLALVLIFSCKKSETFVSAPLQDYMPLEVGKHITYRLDSMLFVSFGQKDTTIYYTARDVVDAEITDNLGRPAFRIIRYLRDTASTSDADWQPSITYMVVPTRETIEVVENNLRFQKLKLPIREGFNWRGNTFLPSSPFESISPFSNDEDMQYWDLTYHDVGQPATVLNRTYDNTITIQHVADSVNVPITFPGGPAYKNLWVEKYAEGVGLIYREVSMWEYQPPNGQNPGYRTGFGLKMQIIDHN